MLNKLLEQIGSIIRSERVTRNFTAEDVAQWIRTDVSNIYGYENGTRSLSLKQLCKLAEIFGKTPVFKFIHHRDEVRPCFIVTRNRKIYAIGLTPEKAWDMARVETDLHLPVKEFERLGYCIEAGTVRTLRQGTHS